MRILFIFAGMGLLTSCTFKPAPVSEQINMPKVDPAGVLVKDRLLQPESADAFKKHRDHSDFLIENFFNYVPSPYAAAISEEVRCPSKFKPIFYKNENENNIKSAVSLYAGERYDYGICEDARAKYFSILTLIYCKKSKKSYEIKHFFKLGESAPDYKKIFDEFSCIN